MEIIDGIADLADRYDGFVLDLWGVVHNGKELYPGVPEALSELKARGKGVVFLTNAPRRAWFIANMLDRMGRMALGDDWLIMEKQAYLAQVPMRQVVNLMSGQTVLERADTPWHCSVASESYWSN